VISSIAIDNSRFDDVVKSPIQRLLQHGIRIVVEFNEASQPDRKSARTQTFVFTYK